MISLIVVLTVGAAFAAVVKGFKSDNPASTPLVVVVDEVDCRPTLTRVTARLVGRPHTSQRVDAVEMVVNGRRVVATDIDGIDFKRWFQWEDDGEIVVEIDFPSVGTVKRFDLVTTTARGVARTGVKR